jgi:hypothetical protein
MTMRPDPTFHASPKLAPSRYQRALYWQRAVRCWELRRIQTIRAGRNPKKR